MTHKKTAERSRLLDWPESRQAIRGLPRGPQAIGRESVQEAQKVRIYFGLAESLTDKGYGATTVAEIITRARVSKKSFYELFRDKEDCFLSLYEHAHERLVQQVLGAQKRNMGWFARLQASHRAYLRFFIDNPQFTYAVLVEVYAAGPVALQRRARYHQQFVAYQWNLYERRRAEEPSLPALPLDAFTIVIAGINELVAQWMRDGRTAQLMELEPLLIHLVTAVQGGAITQATAALRAPHPAGSHKAG